MQQQQKTPFSNVAKSNENQYNFVLPGSYVDTDWESLQDPTDFTFGTILLIRPLGLVATLATAYGIQQFYPNIFCYE